MDVKISDYTVKYIGPENPVKIDKKLLEQVAKKMQERIENDFLYGFGQDVTINDPFPPCIGIINSRCMV